MFFSYKYHFFLHVPHIYHQWFFHHDGQQRFTINFFVYELIFSLVFNCFSFVLRYGNVC